MMLVSSLSLISFFPLGRVLASIFFVAMLTAIVNETIYRVIIIAKIFHAMNIQIKLGPKIRSGKFILFNLREKMLSFRGLDNLLSVSVTVCGLVPFF